MQIILFLTHTRTALKKVTSLTFLKKTCDETSAKIGRDLGLGWSIERIKLAASGEIVDGIL